MKRKKEPKSERGRCRAHAGPRMRRAVSVLTCCGMPLAASALELKLEDPDWSARWDNTIRYPPREVPRLCRGGSRSLTFSWVSTVETSDREPPSTRKEETRWTSLKV